MRKQCPFTQTAVQAQFEYWHGYARDSLTADEAMAAAKAEFGACDREECQLWCSYTKEFADVHGFEPGDGWCGLINDQ